MRALPVQSHARHPLNALLGSAGNLRLLRALCTSPAARSVSQLAEATGLTAQGVRNVLGGLVANGIASVAGAGRSQVYSANRGHPLFALVRPLFEAERSRWNSLREGLRKTLAGRPAVHSAWYYGSTARGVDSPGSDFDVAIVVKGAGVDRTLALVRKDLRSLEEAFGLSFSVIGLSMADVARHAASAPASPWWQSMTKDAQMLKGDRPEYLAAG